MFCLCQSNGEYRKIIAATHYTNYDIKLNIYYFINKFKNNNILQNISYPFYKIYSLIKKFKLNKLYKLNIL